MGALPDRARLRRRPRVWDPDPGAAHSKVYSASQVQKGIFKQSGKGYSRMVELAAGEERAKVLGSGQLQCSNISVDAIHVQGLNTLLASQYWGNMLTRGWKTCSLSQK